MIEGLDYSGARPDPHCLYSEGIRFVSRYLSHSEWKNLTADEAHQLADAGIWIVANWETSADRALDGYDAGWEDAQDADAQAAACGMPAGRPIYFSVDWDASTSEIQGPILAYLNGASAILGRDRVGVYGGLNVVRQVLDAGFRWGWQTYAWSYGAWEPRAQVQQYANGVTVCGGEVDRDRAVVDDYGQWKPNELPAPTPPTPDQEDEVTDDQIEKIAQRSAELVWHRMLEATPDDPNPPQQASWFQEQTYRIVRQYLGGYSGEQPPSPTALQRIDRNTRK